MGLEEYKGVFIYAQQVDNELSSIAFELIGKAKELAKDLGTDVTAVLLGSNVKGLTDELGEYGADKVIEWTTLNLRHTVQSHMHRLLQQSSMSTSQRLC